ncbi:hypothetical protein GE09DRAFT_389317 [Coniochaeta sp. 2T2.1]|nr:hypothetical protein GE09DRAFT_389317 [Coniochaeta sp. 2T2.1]
MQASQLNLLLLLCTRIELPLSTHFRILQSRNASIPFIVTLSLRIRATAGVAQHSKENPKQPNHGGQLCRVCSLCIRSRAATGLQSVQRNRRMGKANDGGRRRSRSSTLSGLSLPFYANIHDLRPKCRLDG